MSQPHYDYDKYSDMVKRIQEPMQAWVDLNMKTLQSFQPVKPEDLSKMNRPEEFWEKQLELAVSNGHKAIDYMQKSLQIIEKTMLSAAKEVKDARKQ